MKGGGGSSYSTSSDHGACVTMPGVSAGMLEALKEDKLVLRLRRHVQGSSLCRSLASPVSRWSGGILWPPIQFHTETQMYFHGFHGRPRAGYTVCTCVPDFGAGKAAPETADASKKTASHVGTAPAVHPLVAAPPHRPREPSRSTRHARAEAETWSSEPRGHLSGARPAAVAPARALHCPWRQGAGHPRRATAAAH